MEESAVRFPLEANRGGGAAATLRPFFEEIRNRVVVWSLDSRHREIPFVPARNGADAGIAGAAALCANLAAA